MEETSTSKKKQPMSHEKKQRNNSSSMTWDDGTSTNHSKNNNNGPNPKRSRRGDGGLKKGDANPLARARSSTTRTTTTRDSGNSKSSSPSSLFVENLWHKKSGGGYILFIRYYAYLNHHHRLLPTPPLRRNPADHDNHHPFSLLEQDKKNGSSNQDHGHHHHPPRGESRASKRRRRKRKLVDETTTTSLQEQSSSVNIDTDGMNRKDVDQSLLTKPKQEIVTENRPVSGMTFNNQHPLFQAFARIQKDFKEEQDNSTVQEQLMPFLQALSLPLPISFRVRGWLPEKEQSRVHAEIQQKFAAVLDRMTLDGVQSNMYRAKKHSTHHHQKEGVVLSKNNLSKEAPQLKSWFSEHMTWIARQELGSMLPVLLLARGGGEGKPGWIGPGSRVLDLCASPGSKTLQLLEVVGGTGKVKANDVNPSRLESLRAAVQRADPPNAHRIQYTNVDASQYPIPRQEKKLLDAILCDVPCSGDGTIRKDSHILPSWTPQTSNALHSLQVRILTRALQCLRVGGVLCYSTCSLNPVENEAVVAAALGNMNQFPPDTWELVPLPELKDFPLRPGIFTWSVADFPQNDNDCYTTVTTEEDEKGEEDVVPTLKWYDSYEEAKQNQMVHAVPTLWPPGMTTTQESHHHNNKNNNNNAKPNNHTETKNHHHPNFHLERCGRLWPHDHDCGGFFVALIRRKKKS